MNALTKSLVPGLLLAGWLGGSAWAQTRIATVNLSKVFDKYWRTEQVSAALKERSADLEKDLQKMVHSFDKQKEEYQKLLGDAKNQAVSAEERERRKKAAEDKLRELSNANNEMADFERKAKMSLNEQKNRVTKNLLDEIKPAIENRAKAGGYSLVIDTAAVLYWNDTNDLTDAVLDQLNAAAPIEAPKPEETPAEPKGK